MTMALLAVAVMSTGCSFTISTPHTTLSHQSRIQGACGCGAGETCNQPECSGVDFGQGMPAGFESFASPAPSVPTTACGGTADCGCDSCGDAGMSQVSTDGPMFGGGAGRLLGGGVLGGGPLSGGGVGKLRGIGLGGGSAGLGCGRFGCGRSGKLCMGCLAKSRFGGLGGGLGGGRLHGGRLHGGGLHGAGGLGGAGGHTKPYGGEIPHTSAYPGTGGGAGQAPQYVYPYYTTRGPRDFLMSNPPSIGY